MRNARVVIGAARSDVPLITADGWFIDLTLSDVTTQTHPALNPFRDASGDAWHARARRPSPSEMRRLILACQFKWLSTANLHLSPAIFIIIVKHVSERR
ncbi:hypothetical protein EVAR_29935_1 [Eumeta japonica]|uniref:Uncharacterized protein n=1 Tax=Eumeta variegata TaxID=151549 RepID=A0A4C1VIL2_EUMVA|nr:hypothetical protein EVAR_29935_1 [Eumeta japonica]